MEKTLFPSCYLGPVGYFAAMAQANTVVIEKHAHFLKQTARNRCCIHGANGRLNLVVPIQHTGKRLQMKDVRIANSEEWQRLHWRSLEAAYRSSPYFEFYEEEFYPFYHVNFEFLFDLNMQLQEKVVQLLKLTIAYSCTESYEAYPSSTMDLRSDFNKTATENNSRVYPQVFEDKNGFLPNLSIVDLLFNEGPHSVDYLQGISS